MNAEEIALERRNLAYPSMLPFKKHMMMAINAAMGVVTTAGIALQNTVPTGFRSRAEFLAK